MNAERSDSEDHPDARPSCPDVVLLWEESRYSGKAVAEDRPDKANYNSVHAKVGWLLFSCDEKCALSMTPLKVHLSFSDFGFLRIFG
jgi:hypothetical protein